MLHIDLDKSKKYGFAVSGGVDSMVMLELCKKAGLSGIVITVDHGLRDVSKEEVRFVEDVATSYGYKTVVRSIDCKQYAADNKLSVELAGRLLRYEFFEEVQKQEGLDYILLAHQLDDQVETILMRILRGSGIYGLRGIADRDVYLHPMIRYPKAEIIEYATRNNIEYREDSTNAEVLYRRNVLRNIILPKIEQEYPDYRQAFIRLRNAAEETEDYFTTQLLPYICDGQGVVFKSDIFSTHRAIAKRSIRRALYDIGIHKDFEEKNYQTLFSLDGSISGTTVELGQGLVARFEYGKLIVEKAAKDVVYEAPFAEDMVIKHLDKEYSFSKTDDIEKGTTFDIDKVPKDAVVRTRQAGDLFKRCNGKSKSLSDYLTDAKIPHSIRRSLLYLASGNKILAILGMEIADDVKIDAHTKTMIKVTKRDV